MSFTASSWQIIDHARLRQVSTKRFIWLLLDRSDLLDKLNSQLLMDRKSWRLREQFTQECLSIIRQRKISPENINHIICCFALTFMDDSVNGVRIAGAELLAEIFTIFIEKEWPTNALTLNVVVNLESIINAMPLTKALLLDSRRSFLKSNSWRRRQTYSIMLEFLLKNAVISLQQFFFIFSDDVQAIANDKVSNTRMKFCSIFQSISDNHDITSFIELFPSIHSNFRETISKMAEHDSDFEVQSRARMLLGSLDPVTDSLDYDNYQNLLTEREGRMWKNFTEHTGIHLQDISKPKDIIVKEFETIQCLSIEEV